MYWPIISAIIIILNLAPAVLKELYCYQIRKSKCVLSLKDNINPLLTLGQKTLIILLLYLVDNSDIVTIVLNVLFALVNLYMLHTRLTYYNIKMLKLQIVTWTMALWISGVLIARAANFDGNLFLIAFVPLPVIIKASLIGLNMTFKRILRLEVNSPERVLHLPMILKGYKKQVTNLPMQKKTNISSLYVSSLVGEEMEEILAMKAPDAAEEIKTRLYQMVAEKYVKILKTNPKNEMLLLNLAQLYINKLGDASKAIALLNKMKTYNLSTAAHNSIEDIDYQLENMYMKDTQIIINNFTHMAYFKFREKTLVLKQEIQKEIDEHLNLWRGLNESNIQSLKVVTQTENISRLATKIEQYWNQHFDKNEKSYVNAPLMYGLYLDVIRGLPFQGVPLVQKSYELLLNKQHQHRDLAEVATGHAAIIVASIEPEKLGRIIDASASVKKLFNVEKSNFIDTNINMVLPKVVAKRHDKFIMKFQKHFKHDLDRHFVSYAKTINGDYFPVEITLRLYPSMHKGLNLMAYIRRMAMGVPTLIVDYQGKIVEFSKEIMTDLNLSEKQDAGVLELSKLCPEFAEANSAFNRVYKSRPITYMIDGGDFNVFDSQVNPTFAVAFRGDNAPSKGENASSSHHKSTIYEKMKTSAKEVKEELEGVKSPPFVNSSDKSFHGFTLGEKDAQSRDTKFSHGTPMKEMDEAICKVFREGKILNFTAQASSGFVKRGEMQFEIRVDPIMIDGDLFKVVKFYRQGEVRKMLSSASQVSGLLQQQKTDLIQKRTFTNVTENFKSQEAVETTFADDFPMEIERGADPRDRNKDREASIQLLNRPTTQMTTYIMTSPGAQDNSSKSNNNTVKKEETQANDGLKSYKILNASRLSQTGTSLTSQRSSTRIAKHLNNVFRQERISSSTRISIVMVFLSVVVVIVAVIINLLLTTSALNDLNDSMTLVNLVNIRQFRTLTAWQQLLVVYTYSARVTTFDTTLDAVQEPLLEAALNLLDNNDELQESVDNFKDDGVTAEFFKENIELWVPYEGHTSNWAKTESFTANRILTNKFINLGTYVGSIYDLYDDSDMLFALNNTANDYAESVGTSTDVVQSFFQKRKNENISTLTVIVIAEILALLLPFLSVVVLFKNIFASMNQLFKVVSKIQSEVIYERVVLIENMQSYFKENIEDHIKLYNDFKPSNIDSAKQFAKDTKAKALLYQNRNYSMRSLLWNMSKYLIFAFVLIIGIMALFIVSFVYSLTSFNTLDSINSDILLTYEIGANVAYVTPSYYFYASFNTRSEFKIKNKAPATMLTEYIAALSEANNQLLNTLYDGGSSSKDSVVEDMLNTNLCSYLSSDLKESCMDATQDDSFGLLGLNSKFYQTYGIPIQDYLDDPVNNSPVVLDNVDTDLKKISNTLDASYEYLADHILDTFQSNVKSMKKVSLILFVVSVVAILVAMNSVRTVAIARYKGLDVMPRKIFRIIPYTVIQKSKVLGYYLNQEFKNEMVR